MNTVPPRSWRRPPRIRSPWLRRVLIVGGLLYIALAIASIGLDLPRLREGLPRGARFLAALFHPDFATRWSDIRDGMLESLAMALVATAAGVVLSIPVALGAARNLSPAPLYLLSRAAIALARSLQEVIVAIFFVVIVGFGPMAGVLTLAFASVGFLGKLLAEAIEAIDRRPVEAIRATGAGPAQILLFGVVPQILPRLVGLSAYRLDINFRESAVIGVVGAGGIGATLLTAFGRYEFGTAAAILLLIVAVVLAGEIAAGRLRRSFV